MTNKIHLISIHEHCLLFPISQTNRAKFLELIEIKLKIKECLERFGKNNEQRIPGAPLKRWFQNICSQFAMPSTNNAESCRNFNDGNGEYIRALEELRNQYPSVLRFGREFMKSWQTMLNCASNLKDTDILHK